MNKEIKKIIEEADAVVIGAGAGLSTAAGITYAGERFEKNFSDYIRRYNMTDMYSAGFYPFDTQVEKWAYWRKHIFHNRYEVGPTTLYKKLYEMVNDKEHFVLTTNVDHQFFIAGFEEDRIFATQGDYGLFQCSKPCHDSLYDNESIIKEMIIQQENCEIPTSLLPKCPRCGEDMTMHLRVDDSFVQNSDWDKAHLRYQQFIEKFQHKKVVFLELGVGMNTPMIIKYPFWKLTHQMEDAFYICLNKGEVQIPDEIKEKSLCFDVDIREVFLE